MNELKKKNEVALHAITYYEWCICNDLTAAVVDLDKAEHSTETSAILIGYDYEAPYNVVAVVDDGEVSHADLIAADLRDNTDTVVAVDAVTVEDAKRYMRKYK